MAKYEFAIKKDVLNSGKVIHTPVCRKKSRLGKWNPNPWVRIVKIYDEYVLMDLHFIPDLSYEECKEHISGYQGKLLKSVENQVAEVEFHALEEKSFQASTSS